MFGYVELRVWRTRLGPTSPLTLRHARALYRFVFMGVFQYFVYVKLFERLFKGTWTWRPPCLPMRCAVSVAPVQLR